MNTSIWEIVADTPWWVFALFAYLMYIGLAATKPRIVPIKKIMILPSIFLSLSIIGICFRMHITPLNMAYWVGALFSGILIGWVQFYALKIKAIKDQASIYMPGTWLLLFLILALFSVKYYYGYQTAVDPQLANSPAFIEHTLLIYGFFTGIFVGRAAYALRCMKIGPFYAA